MNSELGVCTAAFFRNKGKDIITVKELTMAVSLDLRWMPVKEANRFAELIVAEGYAVKTKDGLLKLADGLENTDVPVAYKPSKDLLAYIATSKPSKPLAAGLPLPGLLEMAEKAGMKKGEFIAECNQVVKKLNVDIEVAALLILRDASVNVSGAYDAVYAFICAK